MSFTTAVKQELNRTVRERSCCRTAEIAALFRAAGSFHIKGRDRFGIHAAFGLSATARTAASLVKSFHLPFEVRVHEESRLRQGKRYEVWLEGGDRLVQFLNEIGILSDSLSLQERLPARLIKKPCCRTAFLRGAFLAAGSVNRPGAATHLEIYSQSDSYLDTVSEAARGAAIRLSRHQRVHNPAVYTKNLDTVRDLLVMMGAHQASLEFEERSIVSSIRADANRRANFDQANAVRSGLAAARQVRAINRLQESGQLDQLPGALKEMAELRLRHPFATIVELGRHARPPLGKSAVNHRLRRLVKLAGEQGDD